MNAPEFFQHTLRTAHRPVRLCAAGIEAVLRPAKLHRASRFAQTRRARWQLRGRLWRGVNLIWRQAAPRRLFRQTVTHTHLHAAPVIRLTLTGQQRERPAKAPGLNLLVRYRQVPYRQPESSVPRIVPAHGNDPGKRSAAGMAAGAGRDPFPRVPRVVHRTERKPSKTTRSPSETAGRDRKWIPDRDENNVARRPEKAPGAAIDVRRLADEVVRTIDRRITAQRERLGRG